jgi:thiamine kinase-like enzyme
MKALRYFHEKMQPYAHQVKDTTYAPFALIFDEGQRLEKAAGMPSHFTVALKKIEQIFNRLKPWLENHLTLCHGDFHKGNVLLSKTKALAPMLIDFDSMSAGHPLFDVVKFSISLPLRYRMEMFSEYLGHLPTPQEQSHFELMDLALLMVIATVRFKSAQNAQNDSQDRLTQTEIEAMLNSEESLPSFLKMPFGDTSVKARQKGATYALGEFLKRTDALSFTGLIDNLTV